MLLYKILISMARNLERDPISFKKSGKETTNHSEIMKEKHRKSDKKSGIRKEKTPAQRYDSEGAMFQYKFKFFYSMVTTSIRRIQFSNN